MFIYFQFLWSNGIGSKEFSEYFSITPISFSQVTEKLRFEEGYLSLNKTKCIDWFKEWIQLLSTNDLKKFCINVTGFEYLKEEIMVNYYLIYLIRIFCIKLKIYWFIKFFFKLLGLF